MDPSVSELVNKVNDLKRELEESQKKLKEQLEKEQLANEKLERRSQYITRGEVEDMISAVENKIRELSISIDCSNFAPYTETNSKFQR